jgi:peptide chain release factor subunit 1
VYHDKVLCSGRYFDEISQDTGKYCFGVDDTLKALEMGAVDILIVWENIDIQRFVLKNHATDGKSKLFALFPVEIFFSPLTTCQD